MEGKGTMIPRIREYQVLKQGGHIILHLLCCVQCQFGVFAVPISSDASLGATQFLMSPFLARCLRAYLPMHRLMLCLATIADLFWCQRT